MAKQRKRGSGGISHRKDGRWEGRLVIGYDNKGLPKTKNVLAKTKTECAEKLKALQEQYAKPKEDAPKSDITFGEWLDQWYQEMKKPAIRPNTQMSYEQRIYRHLIPALGGIQLSKLTQDDFQKFYTEMKKNGRKKNSELYGEGLSDETVRGCHSTARAALNAAVEKKLIVRNPTDDCKCPNVKKREMQLLTNEEMQKLLIQAKEDNCYEILLLELSTGLRRGEICALQWDDLNLRTGELRIQRQVHRVKGKLVISEPKTKATMRSIILPPTILAALVKYKEHVNSRWLFPSPVKEDSPRDPAAMRKRLSIVLERAGCKKVRFHDLRHSFATMSLAHGMDVKTLATTIGHSSATTTLNTYAHTSDEMRKSAAAKIDKGIAKAKESASDSAQKKHVKVDFTAYKGQRRKAGTGCVYQINKNLWEGKYSPWYPDGKRHPHNVYAHSKAECEAKLAAMIPQVKAEIALLKGIKN